MHAVMDTSSAAAARAEVDLAIEGMTCAACASRIEKVLNRLPRVEASVNFAAERAHVGFDPATVGVTELIEAIRKAGYDAHSRALAAAEDAGYEQADRRESRLLYAAIALTGSSVTPPPRSTRACAGCSFINSRIAAVARLRARLSRRFPSSTSAMIVADASK